MANIKKYQTRRLSIKGGEAQLVQVQGTDINVLRFINWGQTDLRISQHSDPQNYPEVVITGNGGTNNMMDPAGISRLFIYAAADVQFGLVEIQVEDPMLILAMESVVANLLTSLPAGTAHVGSMSIDQGGTPVAAGNPLPVDVTDEAGRQLGQVSFPAAQPVNVSNTPNVAVQVGGAGVTTANPVPTRPANGVAPVVITAAGVGAQQVKAAAGRLFSIIATVQVTIRNGAADLFLVPANVPVIFLRPVECAASIQLNFSAAGTAYVQYE